MAKKLTVEDVVKAIDIPVLEWVGNCYAISSKMLQHKLVNGKLRYGHWLGKVEENDTFCSKQPFQRHGWIEQPGGQVVDPTRWVFEAEAPYIYAGPNDGMYDMGGNSVRTSMHRECPEFDDSESVFKLPEGAVGDLLSDTLGVEDKASMGQVLWLANQHPESLLMAPSVYEWLVRNKFKALIPIDNWNYAMN